MTGSASIEPDSFAALIGLLRDGDFAEYDKRSRPLASGPGSEQLWGALALAHGKDFDLLERLLAWPSEAARGSLYRLAPAVARLPALSLADARRFLDYAARFEVPYWHVLSQQLQSHFATQPDLPRAMIEELGHAEASALRRRVWAGALAMGAPVSAAGVAVELVLAENDRARLGTVLLQYLPVADSPVATVLLDREDSVVARLVALTPTLGEDAWFALTSLSSISPGAADALTAGVAAADEFAILAAAEVVSKASQPTFGASTHPLQAIVRSLITHAMTTDPVRRAVDTALASRLYSDGVRHTILECLVELGGANGNVLELLPQVAEALEDRHEDFSLLFTTWLVAEGVNFNNLRALLSRCISMRAPATLHVATFAAAPMDRKVVGARRLLALTHHGPVLCKFIACLAESPALQPTGLEFAAKLLNAAYQEYPNATVEFLQARTRSNQRHEPHASVYRGVLANATRWGRVLQRLPRLQELRIDETQRRALHAVRQRINRDIMKAAETGSLMAAFATKVNIAQGHRSATHMGFGAPQVVEMHHHSYAVELPSSELADPVGGLVRRRQQLIASR